MALLQRRQVRVKMLGCFKVRFEVRNNMWKNRSEPAEIMETQRDTDIANLQLHRYPGQEAKSFPVSHKQEKQAIVWRIHAAFLERVTELIQGKCVELREGLKGATMILRTKNPF